MANYVGTEAKVEVKGLLMAVLVDLGVYFVGKLVKDAGGVEGVRI